jgi:hypothetical protein
MQRDQSQQRDSFSGMILFMNHFLNMLGFTRVPRGAVIPSV